MKDVLILSLIAFLLIVPLKKNLNFEKKWSEEKLWPAVEVNENTGRVHAGCATFEYLPSKAYEKLDYIKTRENKVYVIQGIAKIKNEEKNGTKMTFEVVNAKGSVTVELPYIYYLGYQIEIEYESGNIQKIQPFESDNGFVAFELEDGQEGIVKVKYTGTSLMKISYIISFVTLLGIMVWSVVRIKRR